MKILSPVDCVEEVRSIVKAGADELYCGVLSSDWKNRFSNTLSINRRDFRSANMRNYGELKAAVKEAHNSSVPVFLTMNGLYSEEQYRHVLLEIDKARTCDVDGFIVADLGLLLQLEGRGLDIHLSTGATVFSSEDVKFFQQLGVSKITIDNHMSLEEIKRLISKNKDVEFSVFAMYRGCINIDGFCTFNHGIGELKIGNRSGMFKPLEHYIRYLVGNKPAWVNLLTKIRSPSSTFACDLNYKVRTVGGSRNEKAERNIASIFGFNFRPGKCGGCALYDFKRFGVSSLKIVGRGFSTETKANGVRFLKKLLQLLDENPSKAEFCQYAKQEYEQVYKRKCSRRLCHHP